MRQRIPVMIHSMKSAMLTPNIKLGFDVGTARAERLPQTEVNRTFSKRPDPATREGETNEVLLRAGFPMMMNPSASITRLQGARVVNDTPCLDA